MKTTIDLPRDLVHAMKLRALHEGRKLKDIAAELLRSALHPVSPPVPRATTGPLAPKTLPTLKPHLPRSSPPARTPQEFCDFIKQADSDLDAKTPGH